MGQRRTRSDTWKARSQDSMPATSTRQVIGASGKRLGRRAGSHSELMTSVGRGTSDMAPRRKLIEVALPLEAINRESAREKTIRHGHPSTLHLWWARRPLAACRAVLFASLVDDPDSDPVYRRPDGSEDEEAAGLKRAELFNLIE